MPLVMDWHWKKYADWILDRLQNSQILLHQYNIELYIAMTSKMRSNWFSHKNEENSSMDVEIKRWQIGKRFDLMQVTCDCQIQLFAIYEFNNLEIETTSMSTRCVEVLSHKLAYCEYMWYVQKHDLHKAQITHWDPC